MDLEGVATVERVSSMLEEEASVVTQDLMSSRATAIGSKSFLR